MPNVVERSEKWKLEGYVRSRVTQQSYLGQYRPLACQCVGNRVCPYSAKECLFRQRGLQVQIELRVQVGRPGVTSLSRVSV
jgi:hypothetical protein